VSWAARLAVAWAANVGGLWLAADLIDGVTYGADTGTLLGAALVLALANSFVRPVVTVLALPVIILTLGLALFLVSLLMLVLTSEIVDRFALGGFWNAVGATIVVWAVNVVVQAVARLRR
jgi:putative membrane protein